MMARITATRTSDPNSLVLDRKRKETTVTVSYLKYQANVELGTCQSGGIQAGCPEVSVSFSELFPQIHCGAETHGGGGRKHIENLPSLGKPVPAFDRSIDIL
jgi:hypothetical protein